MSKEVQYKGFVVEADPELLETGQWSTFCGNTQAQRITRVQ
ncbi:MAG: hypothetical protein ACXWL9_11375 [Syntrophales bacterium]